MLKKLVRIVFFILISVGLAAPSFSSESDSPGGSIRFVYIHGTNYNSPAWEARFKKDVSRLHKAIKKRFLSSKIISTNLLKNNQLVILDEPFPFYWGDKTVEQVEELDKDLSLSNRALIYSFNQAVRKLINHVLHDALWIENESNQQTVLNDLHSKLEEKEKAGEKLVLLGHSAGSLVTFHYLTNHLAYINTAEAFSAVGFDSKSSDLPEYTCVRALEESMVISFNSMGELSLYPNVFKLSDINISTLISNTDMKCLDLKTLKGFITCGSPLSVFSTSLRFAKTQLDNFSLFGLAKAVYNNDLFWLHVNHLDDPIALGLPADEFMEEMKHQTGRKPKGFIDNYMKNTFGANLVSSHIWYWYMPGAFAKSIVKSYEHGYRKYIGNLDSNKN